MAESEDDLFCLCGLDGVDFEDIEEEEPTNQQQVHYPHDPGKVQAIEQEKCFPKRVLTPQKSRAPKTKAKKAPFKNSLRGQHLCESQAISTGENTASHQQMAKTEVEENLLVQKHREDVALFSKMEQLDQGDDNVLVVGLGLASALDALGRRGEALDALNR